MHRTYSSTSIRMPLKPKSWAHHRLTEFQMATPLVFITSSLQLFLVTWCCCLVATKNDVPLLLVFGTGNDVTIPNRRISATLELHFFSCTLPKKLWTYWMLLDKFICTRGKKDAGQLWWTPEVALFGGSGKRACAVSTRLFSRNRDRFEVEGFPWKPTFVKQIMTAISRFKTKGR